MKPIEQEFHLARDDADWTIRSLSAP